MFQRYIKILPYFVVLWLTKRTAELLYHEGNWKAAQPFRGEIVVWEEKK